MEPMKPETVNRILSERKDVTRTDIQEFYRLAAQRLETNPNVPPSPGEVEGRRVRDARLALLRGKLFGADTRS
jgi:hypothetical protein